jgi:transcriptional regulator with GAF, ATPase, and Fis domain
MPTRPAIVPTTSVLELIRKIGANGTTKADVRIIAATHRNLATMVAEGTFREDLYYRLLVVPITVPPLRDRLGDIPELVQHFFLKSRAKHGRPALSMPSAMLRYFAAYDWPGNIRQLRMPWSAWSCWRKVTRSRYKTRPISRENRPHREKPPSVSLPD